MTGNRKCNTKFIPFYSYINTSGKPILSKFSIDRLNIPSVLKDRLTNLTSSYTVSSSIIRPRYFGACVWQLLVNWDCIAIYQYALI